MNGALCSQSEAHPWWKLLKTIAGIEAHELNTTGLNLHHPSLLD